MRGILDANHKLFQVSSHSLCQKPAARNVIPYTMRYQEFTFMTLLHPIMYIYFTIAYSTLPCIVLSHSLAPWNAWTSMYRSIKLLV